MRNYFSHRHSNSISVCSFIYFLNLTSYPAKCFLRNAKIRSYHPKRRTQKYIRIFFQKLNIFFLCRHILQGIDAPFHIRHQKSQRTAAEVGDGKRSLAEFFHFRVTEKDNLTVFQSFNGMPRRNFLKNGVYIG